MPFQFFRWLFVYIYSLTPHTNAECEKHKGVHGLVCAYNIYLLPLIVSLSAFSHKISFAKIYLPLIYLFSS